MVCEVPEVRLSVNDKITDSDEVHFVQFMQGKLDRFNWSKLRVVCPVRGGLRDGNLPGTALYLKRYTLPPQCKNN